MNRSIVSIIDFYGCVPIIRQAFRGGLGVGPYKTSIGTEGNRYVREPMLGLVGLSLDLR